MKHHVPLDWTPDNALAVVELLQSYVDAIWNQYADELIELIADRSPPSPDIDDDQFDLPF